MTLNLNDFEASSGPTNDFSLIPAGTIARAIITIKPGMYVMEMFGKTQSFHYSANSRSLDLEKFPTNVLFYVHVKIIPH